MSHKDRTFPVPGDVIIVEFSEWYALKDGERLRVCENPAWIVQGEEIFVAPRHQVNTFWGPSFGPPDGTSPMKMDTSGGPFKTVKIKALEGLELLGEEEDRFWHWRDKPCAGGGVDRLVSVSLWRVALLPDAHYRNLKAYGCKTHRDEVVQ